MTAVDIWQSVKPKTQSDVFVGLVKRDLIPTIGKENLIKIAKNYAVTKFTVYEDVEALPPYTPTALIKEITDKLIGSVDFSTAKFLVIYTVEWANYLQSIHGVPAENITVVGDSKRFEVSIYQGYNFITADNFLADDFNKEDELKFDVIVGNPPFQSKKNEGFKKSSPIWQNFVEVSVKNLKKYGLMSLIHPSGWRNAGGAFEPTKNLLLSTNLTYLVMNNVSKGVSVFGASTRYDWYILQKNKYQGVTTVVDDNGETIDIDLRSLPFIPSRKIQEISKYVAKDGEDKVTVLHSRSTYGSDREHMSSEETQLFQYPCIQNIGYDDSPTKIWWSSVNNGHFGIPKVIFGRFGTGVLLDSNGDYGTCQDCSSIVSTVSELPMIKKALQHPDFIEIMNAGDVGGLGTTFNRRVIATLRKDFWLDFQ